MRLPSPSGIKNRFFYGWLLVANFFVIGIAIFGIRMSFGVFFKSLEAEFDLTRAATSGIFSVYMALGALFAMLGGWASDRYGPKIVIFIMGLCTGFGLLLTSQTRALWQLFISYSLLLSVGSALFTVLTSTISRWFNKNRTLALGIAQSGAGFGTVLMTPLAAYLIAALDWRMAYIILGLVAWLVIIPLSRFLKREPGEIGALPDGKALPDEDTAINGLSSRQVDLPLARIMRTRNFWFFISGFFLFAFCLFMVIAHLVPHATDIGISVKTAAAIVSLIGGSAIAGRILMGLAADRIGRKLTAVITLLVQTAAMLWLAWAHDLWAFYLFALVYGFAMGGFSPATSSLVGGIFGLRKLGAIMGILDIGFSIGAAAGPLIGGLIFDISNDYTSAFSIAALGILLAALLIGLTTREVKSSYGNE